MPFFSQFFIWKILLYTLIIPMLSGRAPALLGLISAPLVVVVVALLVVPPLQQASAARVEGFAHDFLTGRGIVAGELRMLEDPNFLMKTDSQGRFAFDRPVGSNVTLVISKWDIHETQTGTVTVPPQGLVGVQHELTLQVPDLITFAFLRAVLPGTMDPTKCHLVTTVSAKNKTLYDDPQGEPNATISVSPPVPKGSNIYYFGIIMGKTNPFARGLNQTSYDGGVLVFNVPPGDYVMTASKKGVVFGDPPSCFMKCKTPGRLINASPPWGPRVK
jgi:hypothetical protein